MPESPKISIVRRRLTKKAEQIESPTELRTLEGLKGETILVIDDSMLVIDLVGELLQREGYNVIATTDQSTALKLAEEKTPSLIVSDVKMPGLDGISLCRILRETPMTQGIPIIMFTTQIDRMADAVRSDGPDHYVIKSPDPSELIDKIKECLTKEE